MQVARRHDQQRRHSVIRGGSGFGEVVQQQVLHGGVGQHDAQLGQVVSQTGRERGAGALLQQHDGALRAFEHRAFRIVHLADTAHVLHRVRHDGERLALAALARTQRGHGFRVVRVAHQMEAAQALDGQDLPRQQQLHGARQDGVALLARRARDRRAKRRMDDVRRLQRRARHVRLHTGRHPHRRRCTRRFRKHPSQRARQALVLAPTQMRPACEARVRLRVEAAVERIALFAGAALAHRKFLMDVLLRSSGSFSMMVKRGPQFVQLMNG